MGMAKRGGGTMRERKGFLAGWLSELSEGKPLRAFLGVFLIGVILILVLIKALFDPSLRARSRSIS
jgi:hypothetical protein